MEGNNTEAVEQEDRLCDEVETARKMTYLDVVVSADGGCEAALTARGCGLILGNVVSY